MTDRLTELLTDETTPTDGDWDARDARNAFRELLQPEVQALRDRVRELERVAEASAIAIQNRDDRIQELCVRGADLAAALRAIAVRWNEGRVLSEGVTCVACNRATTLVSLGLPLRATLEGEATG